jgi:NTE family protein
MDGRATVLSALPGLQDEAPAVLLALADRFEVRLLDRGWLCREGDRSSELYVIIEGHLEVYRSGRRLTALGPGTIVGHVGALSGAPRSAGLRAAGAVALMVMDAEVARTITDVEEGPDAGALRRALLVALGRQLREASRALVKLAEQAPGADAAAVLLEARGRP